MSLQKYIIRTEQSKKSEKEEREAWDLKRMSGNKSILVRKGG